MFITDNSEIKKNLSMSSVTCLFLDKESRKGTKRKIAHFNTFN